MAFVPALATVLSIAAVVRLNSGFLDDALLRKLPFEADAARDNVEIALALRAICLPGATVGVSWAGAIPYYSGLPAVDFFGKSDPRIAALPPDLGQAEPAALGGRALRLRAPEPRPALPGREFAVRRLASRLGGAGEGLPRVM